MIVCNLKAHRPFHILQIAHFIKALKDNENLFKAFTDIELVSIKKGSMAEQDVMLFNLICRFKPQETRD